ncbi:MAG: hypothetical protein HGA65_00615 [Oscillochloris sp.]|nr:hypothetical protein [Oscillochloris sp.]
MNNSGAIYIEYADHRAVAAELARLLAARGFCAVDLPPDQVDSRMMIPAKHLRHFMLLPTAGGWVVIWEDPRYFAERKLAQQIAASLQTRAVWIEVSGTGVSWARGLYVGEQTVEEQYEEVNSPFYGEFGIVHFSFDFEHPPEDFISALGLPYDDLCYESALLGELPAAAGVPIHLAFEKL